MTIKKEILAIRDTAWARQEDSGSSAENLRIEFDAVWEALTRIADHLDDNLR